MTEFSYDVKFLSFTESGYLILASSVLEVSCDCFKSKKAAKMRKTIRHLANRFEFSQNSALITSKNCKCSGKLSNYKLAQPTLWFTYIGVSIKSTKSKCVVWLSSK